MWFHVKLPLSYSQGNNSNSSSNEGIVGNIEIDSEAEVYCTQCTLTNNNNHQCLAWHCNSSTSIDLERSPML